MVRNQLLVLKKLNLYSSGDVYFTDPVFGKMTLNANILRGNMHEMPELDTPGYSAVYHYREVSDLLMFLFAKF